MGADLDVHYIVSGEAQNGTDFQNLSGVLTIPAGESVGYIDVAPLDDDLVESEESLKIRLASSPGYWLGSESKRQVSGIIKGELPPVTRPALPSPAVLSVDFEIGNGDLANFTYKTGQTIPGSSATDTLEIENTDLGQNPWDIRPYWLPTRAIRSGDNIKVSFRARALPTNGNPATGQVTPRFELANAPYTGVERTFNLNGNWRSFSFSVPASIEAEANEWSFDIRTGYGLQKVEIADVELEVTSEPVDLLPSNATALENIESIGNAQFSNTTETVNGQPLDVLQVDVLSFENVFDVRARYTIDEPVLEGDSVLVSLWARTLDSGLSFRSNGVLTVRQEQSAAPFPGFTELHIVTTDWKQLIYRLPVSVSSSPGEWTVDLQFGHALQSLQVADISAKLVPQSAASSLPTTIIDYAGRDQSATWRSNAIEQIVEHRDDPVSINVVNAVGQPVQDAVVTLELIQPEFQFGTAINSDYITGGGQGLLQDADSIRYRSIVEGLFDRAVSEGQTQWSEFDNDPTQALQMAEYANSVGLDYHGHSVIWGNLSGFPTPDAIRDEYEVRFASDPDDAKQWLKNQVLSHAANVSSTLSGTARNETGQTKPLIDDWDVINHPVLFRELWDIVGEDVMLDVLDIVKANANPATKAYFNESGILSSRTSTRDEFFSFLEDSLDEGAEIDGIGIQGHFASDLIPPIDDIVDELVRYQSLGLEMMITEFDLDDLFIDEQTRADFARDFASAIQSTTASVGFTFWGFWENRHWRSDEGAYWVNSDWTLTPAGISILDVMRQDDQVVTIPVTDGSQARTSLPAGQYKVTVTDESGRSYPATQFVTSDQSLTISAVDLEKDLVGYWSFDEADGATIADLSSNGQDNSGSLVGSAQIDPSGIGGGSLRVLDDGSLFSIPNSPDINQGIHGQRSISLWFYADDLSVPGKQVIYEEGGTARGLNVYLFNGQLYAGGWNTTETQSGWAGSWVNANVQENTWHHVSLVLDAGPTVENDALTLWLNGAQIETASGSQLWSHTDPIGAGNDSKATFFHDGSRTGATWLHGLIDELRIYNRPFSAGDVGVLGQAQPANTTSGLVGYWSFDEADGTAVPDISLFGQDNSGSLIGNAEIDPSGVGGGSLRVLDANSLFSIPNSPDINQGIHGQRTISLWFYADDLSVPGKQVIFEEGGTARGLNVYLFDGQVYAGGWNTSVNQSGWAGSWINTTIQENTWNHVSFVLGAGPSVENDTLTLWLNGNRVATTSGSQLWPHGDPIGAGNDSEATLFHDRSRGGATWVRGLIDELRIYNRPLAAGEVEVLSQAQPVDTTSGPTGYWSSDEADGITIPNRSSFVRNSFIPMIGLFNVAGESIAASIRVIDSNTLFPIRNRQGFQRQRGGISLWFSVDDLSADGKQGLFDEEEIARRRNAHLLDEQV